MRLPLRYTVISACAPAKAVLKDYLFRLTGREETADGYPIRLELLPPKADASPISGDERFSIRVHEKEAALAAHSLRGAMYAAYAFLEDFLGCRFLSADVDTLPNAPELALGEKDYAPAFLYRELYWRGALDGDFALKMRLNSARAAISDEKGGRVRFFNYSHTFEQLVPPETYFDAHPEYFSLVNGKRQKEKSQLCLTNEDVFRLCLDGVRRWMREHPDERIFSVAQNDWYGFCECEQCRAVDEREGSHAGTMLAFVNRIADAIYEEFPQNYIHTFAYLYTRTAPKTLRPRRNVIVRLCSIESCFSHPMRDCEAAIAQIDVEAGAARTFKTGERLFREDLTAWGNITPNLFIWDYTTNYANYLQPFPNLHVLADNLRLMKENGVCGVFEQGNYAPGETSAFAGLKIYLLSHLLWTPDADVERLVDDYVTGWFGAAAAPIREYLRLMENAAQTAHMSIFDAPDAAYLPDEVIAEGRKLMQNALALCEEDGRKQAGSALYADDVQRNEGGKTGQGFADAQAASSLDEIRRRVRLEALSPEYVYLTRLPLSAPNRDALISCFADEVRALGVTELFERRELNASLRCMQESPLCRDKTGVPYRVYRL